MGDLRSFEPGFVPAPFGCRNLGATCHFNALFQALISNPSVVRTAFENRDYLSRTGVGRAFYNCMWRVARPAVQKEVEPPFSIVDFVDLAPHLFDALRDELRSRRPGIRYGFSQESASEGLVLLLDMLDAPLPEGEAPRENPIARLFYHRYEATVYCGGCTAKVSAMLDVAVQFALFEEGPRPLDPGGFGEALRAYSTELGDYRCERCGRVGTATRHYQLRMVPEVLVCLFNLYGVPRRRPREHPGFPQRLDLPGIGGGRLVFGQTAQVEHSGGLSGGHYVARGIRGDGKVYAFNDEQIAAAHFESVPEVYMVFYHFLRSENADS